MIVLPEHIDVEPVIELGDNGDAEQLEYLEINPPAEGKLFVLAEKFKSNGPP